MALRGTAPGGRLSKWDAAVLNLILADMGVGEYADD